jgi:diacylglycerol kinase family enzyme
VAVGLSTIPLYRGADVELRYDGIIRRVQALMLVVGNSRLYAGRFRLTPQAVMNDGWLDLCIVKGKGPLAVVRQSVPLLLSRSITRADVEVRRVRDLSVVSKNPLPYQVDGELAGVTPVHFSIRPRALRVIVPGAFASSLIA